MCDQSTLVIEKMNAFAQLVFQASRLRYSIGVENIKALEMVFRKAQSRQSISPRKAEKASEFLGLLADAWAQETMLMLEKRS